jgi:hypothetical protein
VEPPAVAVEPMAVAPAGVWPEMSPSPSVVESALWPGEKAITSFAAAFLLSAALLMLGIVRGTGGAGCWGA